MGWGAETADGGGGKCIYPLLSRWGGVQEPRRREGENTFILFYLEKAMGLGPGGLQAGPKKTPEASNYFNCKWAQKPYREKL